MNKKVALYVRVSTYGQIIEKSTAGASKTLLIVMDGKWWRSLRMKALVEIKAEINALDLMLSVKVLPGKTLI